MRRLPSIALLNASLLLLPGCLTTELSSAWEIDRLRILAVRAEPAEPGPGDTVTFESLIVSPDREVELVMWIGCLGDDLDVFGCTIDEEILGDLDDIDPEQMTMEELLELYETLQDAGLMGVEPYMQPTYVIPDDILDDLTEEERNEGLTLFAQITAIPAEDEDEAEAEVEDQDENGGDTELGLKRVPVSDAVTPNHNPLIDHLLFDGVEISQGTVVEVDAGQTYDVEPVLSDDSVEDYEYLTIDDEWEERTEEPYFSVYVQEGSPSAVNTLYPYSDFTWTAPEQPELTEQSLWIVVQDRRGGMNWWTQEISIRE